jgi:hypothetical protein
VAVQGAPGHVQVVRQEPGPNRHLAGQGFIGGKRQRLAVNAPLHGGVDKAVFLQRVRQAFHYELRPEIASGRGFASFDGGDHVAGP